MKGMNVLRVYISGKITGTTDYMERFSEAEKYLKSKGYEVVNPAKVNANLPETFTHRDYMCVCMAMLSCCDAIYMMNGYEDSEGAMQELKYAEIAGYYDIMYQKNED